MTQVLVVDFETDGLDPVANVPTELGAVLWHVESRKPLAIVSKLVLLEGDRKLSPEVERLTGLTTDLLRGPLAVPEADAMVALAHLAHEAEYYVAHNAPFDRAFAEAAAERNFVELPPRPWIDTITDLPYRPAITTRKLVHLAAEHGFVNPFAHRAVFDALTTARLLSLYPFEVVLELHKSPPALLIGMQSFDRNAEARANGFHWDPERKKWTRLVKACQIAIVKATLPFSIMVEPLLAGGAS